HKAILFPYTTLFRSVVKTFSYDREGNKIVGEEVSFNEPTVDADGFEMTFDNVPARGGYTVEYTTTIIDYEISEFTNDATFTYEGDRKSTRLNSSHVS